MTIAFFKYLDYTTSRFCNQNVTSAHTFKLVNELKFKVPQEVNIAHRCLQNILLKGVRVLVIDITNGIYASSRYRVPNQLLSATSLTSLELRGCALSTSSLVDVVKFKSLKQLYLDYVTLNDGMIKCLITGCPLLEELTVHNCYGFKKLHVYGLKNLQKVDLRYHPGLEILSKTRMECRRPSAFIDTLWFQKLRQFLDRYIGFKELDMEIGADLIDIEELKINDWSPFELERIRSDPTGDFKLSVFVTLMDAILWCCLPQSLCLEPYFRIIELKQWCQIVKFTYEKLLQQEDQGQINIRIVLSSSSKAKRRLSNLNSLLTALPLDGPRQSITFIKEEVNNETVSQEAISENGSLQIGE
ncbi:F-box domain, Leucine-rich repeat domain, L domain-like protein [Artemisia annua]|uniref:F-box domain, Leucine-rich repeat domain, L domain-like protein n=1 Tax=Artemisia annua TaxID=35608 RepID=A0A2U1L9L5_ARTAN|nr:F-box domain, Leucine-rich repeat domain, L domain-like protein [Artemisia annua]